MPGQSSTPSGGSVSAKVSATMTSGGAQSPKPSVASQATAGNALQAAGKALDKAVEGGDDAVKGMHTAMQSAQQAQQAADKNAEADAERKKKGELLDTEKGDKEIKMAAGIINTGIQFKQNAAEAIKKSADASKKSPSQNLRGLAAKDPSPKTKEAAAKGDVLEGMATMMDPKSSTKQFAEGLKQYQSGVKAGGKDAAMKAIQTLSSSAQKDISTAATQLDSAADYEKAAKKDAPEAKGPTADAKKGPDAKASDAKGPDTKADAKQDLGFGAGTKADKAAKGPDTPKPGADQTSTVKPPQMN